MAESKSIELPHDFLEAEYNMNLRLSRLCKPVVAIWDGITMGGGIGASIHGSFRICTEKTVVQLLFVQTRRVDTIYLLSSRCLNAILVSYQILELHTFYPCFEVFLSFFIPSASFF